eukprot:1345955-Prymnesium_polylepis.2
MVPRSKGRFCLQPGCEPPGPLVDVALSRLARAPAGGNHACALKGGAHEHRVRHAVRQLRHRRRLAVRLPQRALRALAQRLEVRVQRRQWRAALQQLEELVARRHAAGGGARGRRQRRRVLARKLERERQQVLQPRRRLLTLALLGRRARARRQDADGVEPERLRRLVHDGAVLLREGGREEQRLSAPQPQLAAEPAEQVLHRHRRPSQRHGPPRPLHLVLLRGRWQRAPVGVGDRAARRVAWWRAWIAAEELARLSPRRRRAVRLEVFEQPQRRNRVLGRAVRAELNFPPQQLVAQRAQSRPALAAPRKRLRVDHQRVARELEDLEVVLDCVPHYRPTGHERLDARVHLVEGRRAHQVGLGDTGVLRL